MKLGELARHIGASVTPEVADTEISRIASLEAADTASITFVAAEKYLDAARTSNAGAILVAPDVTITGKLCVQVPNPYLAYALVAQLFEDCSPAMGSGISAAAHIDPLATLGSGCSVGPASVIGAGVVLGDRCRIGAHCVIERGCTIGSDCRIDSGAVICRDCQLGDRVIVQSNAVIGSEGFGNARDGNKWVRIPCFGTVRIGNDAEIGAGTTIDRGNFEDTVIGEGARIDNLVQIAHNCVIGPHTAIAAQAGLSGSTIVGTGAIIAGQAGFAGHLTVGDGAFVGAKAGVSKDVEPGAKVTGYPARDLMKTRRIDAALQQLPELIKTVRALKRAGAPDQNNNE